MDRDWELRLGQLEERLFNWVYFIGPYCTYNSPLRYPLLGRLDPKPSTLNQP